MILYRGRDKSQRGFAKWWQRLTERNLEQEEGFVDDVSWGLQLRRLLAQMAVTGPQSRVVLEAVVVFVAAGRAEHRRALTIHARVAHTFLD